MEGAGFMTYAATKYQVAIEIVWHYVLDAVMVSISL